MPPGQNITAAFMTLKKPNIGFMSIDRGIFLLSQTKLKFMVISIKNGMMSMRPIDGIDIPPKKSISFKPGGYHLMLFGLKLELKKSAQHEITLNFVGCPTVTFSADVRSVLQNKHHH